MCWLDIQGEELVVGKRITQCGSPGGPWTIRNTDRPWEEGWAEPPGLGASLGTDNLRPCPQGTKELAAGASRENTARTSPRELVSRDQSGSVLSVFWPLTHWRPCASHFTHPHRFLVGRLLLNALEGPYRFCNSMVFPTPCIMGRTEGGNWDEIKTGE